MSWNYGFSCTADDFDEKATLALNTWREQAGEDAGTEAHDQASAAISAARVLVDSGAVHHMRGPEGMYDVHISGHANPGHLMREGFAHDVITVTVRQAIPPTHTPNYEPAPEAQFPATESPASPAEQAPRPETRPTPISEGVESAPAPGAAQSEGIIWDAPGQAAETPTTPPTTPAPEEGAPGGP